MPGERVVTGSYVSSMLTWFIRAVFVFLASFPAGYMIMVTVEYSLANILKIVFEGKRNRKELRSREDNVSGDINNNNQEPTQETTVTEYPETFEMNTSADKI